MMSALSDVFERSSQERSSRDRESAERPRSSGDRRPSESSASDHGYELREVRIIDPPTSIVEAPTTQADSIGSPQARTELFKHYRDRMDNRSRPRGPAAASASPFAQVTAPPIPRDSRELRRSGNMSAATSMLTAESIPQGADPAAYAVKHVLEQSGRPSLQMEGLGSLGTRGSSIPQRVRISLSDAAGPPNSAVQSATATLVRKRRRLPWKLLLAFGIVSCLCLIVALTTLSIGVYNFTKLRAARAARTVDQLRGEIEPQIEEILDRVRTLTRLFR